MNGPPCPYKGLTSFEDTELDALFFFGREREREIIAANVMASRVTVLYGQTGVGKSSVLRAGVVRHLRQLPDRLAVVVVDDWRGDPVEMLRTGLEAIGPVGEGDSLADSLEACAAAVRGEIFVLFDGVEEYFLYHGKDRGPSSFPDELARAVNRPNLPASFLLSIREDSLAKLDLFKGGIPNVLGNYLRLDHLDRHSAREAILGPIDRYNELSDNGTVSIEPALVETVLDEVTTGRVELGGAGHGAIAEVRADERIEAPFLQLVMERVWSAETEAGSSVLRLETLQELGGAQEIVRSHLEDALASLTPDERDIAGDVFDHLVTPSGTKIAHRVTDLAGYAGARSEQLEEVLAALASRRILRPVADESGEPGYEIYHDVLAGPVLAWRTEHENRRRLGAERERSRKRQRRLVAVIAAGAVLLAVMAGLTVFAFTQRSEAQRQAAKARAGQLNVTALSELATAPEQAVRDALEVARLNPGSAEDVLRKALQALRVRSILVLGGPVSDASFGPGGSVVATVETAGGKNGKLVIVRPDGSEARTFDIRAHVSATRISPSGRLLAAASNDGYVHVWNLSSGRLVFEGSHAGWPVADVAFSPNERLVATAANDRLAQIWDLRTGRAIQRIPHPRPVRFASFSPDGRLLLTVDGVNARLFDVSTGKRVHKPFALPNPITHAAFSPDGRLIIAASSGTHAAAAFWAVADGTRVAQFAAHRGSILDAEFSPDGKLLVTASADGTARVWTVPDGLEVAELVGHVQPVTKAAFSWDGKFVVTASSEGRALIWEASGGPPLATLAGHAGRLTDASFSRSGLVLTASDDGSARIWDPGIADQLRPLGPAAGHVNAIALDPAGKLVLSAGTAALDVWRVGGGLVRRLVLGGNVTSASFSSDGRLALAADDSGTARAWRVDGWHALAAFRHGSPIRTSAFNPDGRRVLTAAADGSIKVWDSSTGHRLYTLRLGGNDASAAFAPDGSTAAVAGSDGVVRVWRTRDGTPLFSLAAADRPAIGALAFSPDGRRLATASNDKTNPVARIWNLEDKTSTALRGHRDILTSISFSHDGTRLVTTSRDHDAIVWQVHGGKRLQTLSQFAVISDAAFSADDRWLVTAGPASAGLWKTGSGPPEFAAFLREGGQQLKSVAFGPKGWLIVTGGVDGTVREYDCKLCGDLRQLLGMARAHLDALGRHLSPAERQRYLGTK